MDSPIPGSVYGHIKKPLGKLQVQAKNKEEKWHRGIRHRGGEKGKHKGKDMPKKTPSLQAGESPGEGVQLYTKSTQHTDHVWFPTKDGHGNKQR